MFQLMIAVVVFVQQSFDAHNSYIKYGITVP